MKLGTENRKTVILAAVLGVVAILTIVYEFMPTSSTIASTGTTSGVPSLPSSVLTHPAGHHGAVSASGKKSVPHRALTPRYNCSNSPPSNKSSTKAREETFLYRRRNRRFPSQLQRERRAQTMSERTSHRLRHRRLRFP